MSTLPQNVVRFIAVAIGAMVSAGIAAEKAPLPTPSAQAWTSLQSLAAANAAAAPAKQTVAQVDSGRNQVALQWRPVAAAARTFYQTYPADKNAGAAQKLEAVLSLQGVVNGDPAYEQAALTLAQGYRQNPEIPAKDRFEVALLAERVQARQKLGGRASGFIPAEMEKIADKLRGEFGSTPEVYDFYVAVARSGDMATGKRIAQNVLAWPASAPAKAEAAQILERSALLNTRLAIKLKRTDGQQVDLAQQSGKMTLVYLWSPRSTNALGPLKSYAKSLPSGTQIIYVGVGASAVQVQAAQTSAPVPGTFCLEEKGVTGPTLDALHVRHLPYVFVLSPSGTLAGYGPASELTNLVAVANR